MATAWLIENYRPRIIYLIRHPAAVANSFFSLGLSGKQFEPRFSSETLDAFDFDYKKYMSSFWEEHGAVQAVIMHRTLEVLERWPTHRVVKYEDLCRYPVESYRELYRFAELEWSDWVREQIISRSRSRKAYQPGRAGVSRDSQSMIDRWRQEMSAEHIHQVKEAYLSFKPPHYGREAW